jgi:hypothetical protein
MKKPNKYESLTGPPRTFGKFSDFQIFGLVVVIPTREKILTDGRLGFQRQRSTRSNINSKITKAAEAIT